MALTVAVIWHCVMLVLFTWMSGTAAQSTYDIYPVDLCPVNETCLTLSDIVNGKDRYLTSSVTLLFHPGDHSLLGEAVSVDNVSNLTLQGFTINSSCAPATRILCDNSSLSFSSVSDLHIVSIGFVSCRSTLSFTVAIFQDCSFKNSTAVDGGAMAVNSGSNVTFLGCTEFTNNIAIRKGGAIHVDNSVIAFSGKTTFAVNRVSPYFGTGGAVYAEKNCSLSFSGTTSFGGNTGGYGSALFAEEGNSMSFSGNSSFEGNTAEKNGAMLAYKNNIFSFSGNSNFDGNIAMIGGALYAHADNTFSFSGSSNFQRNAALYAGAVFADQNNTLSFSGNSNFEGNVADSGGALYAQTDNSFRFSGFSNFERNTAVRSGSLLAFVNYIFNFSGNSSFQENTAATGGAMYAFMDNTLSFSGNVNFEGNTAVNGGALYANKNNTLSFNGNSNFKGNAANDSGGALLPYRGNILTFSGNSNFEGNTAYYGGALFPYEDSTLRFSGNSSSFSSNAAIFGGAIYAVGSIIELTGSSRVFGNKATYGGGIFVEGGRITFQGASSCNDNRVTQDGYGGAILAINSILKFNGICKFVGNTAGFGGGIALVGITNRFLWLETGSNLFFDGNEAHKRGGALYVEDNPFTYCIFNTAIANGARDSCFIQLSDLGRHDCTFRFLPLYENTIGTQLNHSVKFENNTAAESGNILYGGDLEYCGVCLTRRHMDGLTLVQGSTVFGQVTNANMSSHYDISSDPYKVCICENNQPNCNQTTVHFQVYPGHMVSLAVVSVGQIDGVVPSSVIRSVPENLIITSDFKVAQPTESNNGCAELLYPLFSDKMNARIRLYSEEPCSFDGFPLTVHITFIPCPVGFTLSDKGTCVCEERLQKYTQGCFIQTQTIRREEHDSFWVGIEDTSKPGIILHPHCPFDYCTEEAVDFNINSTDLQCLTGRFGVLCGGCQSGYSLALGNSRCLSGCSNKSLALLLVFAAAGVVLVAFLFLCRLTVAEGTLSGLIFYANLLAVNQNIFFPANTTNILTVFIAWLNLDLGIETCFFVGLDAYSRTWLQFVFPIYIWVLVGLVIYLANVSTTFARIIGRTNPVAVLATLFLLSYTKLLRAIMAAFSFTTLDHPDNESRLVWLYDGNIGYLDKDDGRHVVLFLVSFLEFLFIFLPYAFLLLCGQWIQKRFQLRWISPTKQLYLKTFLDAHYAPFHDKHRYWTGLLLLLRFFIVLLSTITNIESPQDPFVSLVVLLCIVSGMLLWTWLVVHRLYKKWYLDVLEASFIFNLIVLIAGTYQIRLSGGNQAALIYTSVSIAFTTFIGIVISGVVQQANEEVQRRRKVAHQQNQNHRSEEEVRPHSPVNASVLKCVTCSAMEITHRQSSERSNAIELMPIM